MPEDLRTYSVDAPSWGGSLPGGNTFPILPRNGTPLYGDRFRYMDFHNTHVLAELMHAAVFLAFLAQRLNLVDEAILSDTGIIHRIVHWQIGCPWDKDTPNSVCDTLNALHRRVEKRFPDGGVG